MKTKFLILLPAFLLCSLALVRAQGRDVVKLKDGSVIKGDITEYFKGKHLRIRTLEGTVHQFEDSLVAKQKLKNGNRVVGVKRSGYFNSSTFGLLSGSSYGGPAASFQMVNGYQFLGRFSAGIGVGLDGMRGRRVLPVFADLRAYLRNEGVSPFIVVNGGYAFHKSSHDYDYSRFDIIGGFGPPSEFGGGFLGGVRIGVRNYTSKNFGITFSAGYRFQELKREYLSTFWNGSESVYFPVTEVTKAHRMDVRFGIYFN